tara:strand:- start:30779 stop:31537 length:759 start_codon:yes stop_codon:yes gene_type:complete
MMPYLFEFGPIKIPSYGVMLMTAFLSCYYLLNRELKKKGKDPEMASDAIFWAALGGILGAKLYYLLENYKLVIADPVGMIFSGSGLVFWGGLAGGMIAVLSYLRYKNEDWIEWTDFISPLLILGYSIGRVGCTLVGCDYGLPTNLPWAMTFPNGAPPTLIPVHPTQIYETLLGLIIFSILWNLKYKLKKGYLFSLYIFLAGTERFFIEFIRTNPKYLIGLSGAQIISILMITISLILFFTFNRLNITDTKRS